MTLVIGGASQGKLDYVCRALNLGPASVATTPEAAEACPVFAHLECWVAQALTAGVDVQGAMKALIKTNQNLVVICNEVGCGVVPICPQERAFRECVGRLCCMLAEEANCVLRVLCGLPMVIKGELEWN